MADPPIPPAGFAPDASGPAEGGPKPRRAALAFIFVTVMIDMVAMGVTAPVLPRLIRDMAGHGMGGLMNGVFVSVFALMQFLFSPVLGGLSDRFGRRPILLVSIAGLGLNYMVMAVAPNLTWLLVARVLTGITSANMSTAMAYIADVTPAEKRAGAFGLVNAAFGLGFVLGPAIGGVVGSIDPRAPFWVAAGVSLINALYGWFLLPESLGRDRRAPFNWRRANSIGSFRLLASHRELLMLALVNLLTQSAAAVYPAVFVIYAVDRYGWTPMTTGLCLAVFGFCSSVVSATVTGRATAWFGERRVVIIGLAFGMVGMVAFGLANSPWLFLAVIPVMTLSNIAGPAAQALMTRHVEPWEQGQLQGANASLQSLSGIVPPLVFGVVYTLFGLRGRFEHFGQPGAPFLLAAVFMVLATGLAWWSFRGPESRPQALAPAP